MRKTRIFVGQELQIGSELTLAEEVAHHVSRVLRLRSGNALILFDGRGGEYDAVLSRAEKRCVEARINQYRELDNESPLHITLAQEDISGTKDGLYPAEGCRAWFQPSVAGSESAVPTASTTSTPPFR